MREIHVKLENDQYEKIKEVAEAHDMSMSEYVRDILGKQSGVELVIDFADIDKFAEQIQLLIDIVSGIAPAILRSSNINSNEFSKIQKALTEINELCNKIWKYVVDTRTEMYDSVRKELYHSVKQNGYIRRRKFSTTDNKEGV